MADIDPQMGKNTELKTGLGIQSESFFSLCKLIEDYYICYFIEKVKEESTIIRTKTGEFDAEKFKA